jgi:hypothetical protein
MRCARSSPANDGVEEELPEEKPLVVGPLRRSWTATLGSGTGSLRCAPSDLEMMSPIRRPEDWGAM